MSKKIKTCVKCGIKKPLSSFNRRTDAADGLQYWCIPCSRIATKRCCDKLIDDPRGTNTKCTYRSARFKKIFDWYKQLKESIPCADCGIFFPYYVTDFDHRDSSKKSKPVSTMLTYGKNIVSKEIAKCDLVCANCHRVRTMKRKRGQKI